MTEFLIELTELSRKHGLLVTEYMDDLAVVTTDYELVNYIHWDSKTRRYIVTGYMGLPLDDA